MAIDNILPSQTFNDLLNSVNDTIDRLNEIEISTAEDGSGISVDKNTNGDATFSINLCSSSALTITTDNCLEVNFSSLLQTVEIEQTDLFLAQTASGLRKVKSENILPYVIKGDHVFYAQAANSYVSFETDYLLLNSNNILFKNPYIYLNYSVDTNNNFPLNRTFNAGLKIITEDAGQVNFIYDGSISTWLSNKNLGISGTEGRFISKTGSSSSNFTFGLLNSQALNLIKIQHSPSQYWEIFTEPSNNSLNFGLNASTDSQDGTIFKIYTVAGISTLHVMERIYIGDIENSLQFKNTTNFTSGKIPFSNTNGVLNFKWTNRFVTENVLGIVNEGDIVRISTDTDSYVITRADATTEINSEAIGIVEKIQNSSKYYVALSGEFDASTSSLSLTRGETYYLSKTPGRLTISKPNTIVKPILIATGTKTGILLNSAQSQTPLYKTIHLVDENTYLNPTSVNDILSIKAGTGIAITKNSNHELEIFASGGAGTQHTYSRVGGYTARTPNDKLIFSGFNGIEIQVGQSWSDTEIEIHAPNGFGVFEFTTDNTDQEQFTIQSATSNGTFVFNAGVGIKFDRDTNNIVTITATGDSQPGSRTVGNNELRLMTANSVKIGNRFGTPTDLQITDEGVVGRFRDDYGTLSNLIVLTPTTLRKLINAADTGILEENQNTFSAIEVEYNSSVTLIESTQKTDIIRFKAGTGIVLRGEEQTDGDKIITVSLNSSYFTSYVSGFTTVHLPDHTFTSGSTSSVLTFSETSTILPHSVNTNNIDVGFNIKSSSVLNSHLSDMPVNSIKGNNDNTDGSVTDIVIQQNNLFGRPTGGFIKSLSGSEARTILGLTSSVYYKSASINYSGTTTQLPATTGNETLKFVAGTNIQLTTNAANQIVISAQGGIQEYGVKEIKINNDTVAYPTSLYFTSSLIAGNSGYKNIILTKTYNSTTNNYSLNIDMGVMPENSIKIATSTYITNNNDINGYVAGNLVINTNSVLGRFSGQLSSIPMNLLAGSLGINTFNRVEYETTATATSGYTTALSLTSKFKLVGGNGITITGTNLDGVYATPTFTFTANMSKLFDDLTPKLANNLDLNGNSFTSSGIVYFKNNNNNIIAINPSQPFNTTLNIINSLDQIELSATKFNSISSIGNIKLTPYGTGSVVLGTGKLTTGIKDNQQLNMSLNTFDKIRLSSASLASPIKISSDQSISLITNFGNNIGFGFDTTNEIDDLRITKINSAEVLLQSYNSKDLILGATMSGGTSTKSIIFRSNIKFDPTYYVDSDINVKGKLQLLDSADPINRSNYIKKVVNVSSSSDTQTLDTLTSDEIGNVYYILIQDVANLNIKKMFTVKLLNAGAPENATLLVQDEMKSSNAILDNNINGLTFAHIYRSGSLNFRISGVASGKQYKVSFVKVSFN